MRRVSIEDFRKNFDVYFRMAEFENIILTNEGEDFVEILLYRKNEVEKVKITSLHPNGRMVLLKLLSSFPID
jgi:hypothetical protein